MQRYRVSVIFTNVLTNQGTKKNLESNSHKIVFLFTQDI